MNTLDFIFEDMLAVIAVMHTAAFADHFDGTSSVFGNEPFEFCVLLRLGDVETVDEGHGSPQARGTMVEFPTPNHRG